MVAAVVRAWMCLMELFYAKKLPHEYFIELTLFIMCCNSYSHCLSVPLFQLMVMPYL